MKKGFCEKCLELHPVKPYTIIFKFGPDRGLASTTYRWCDACFEIAKLQATSEDAAFSVVPSQLPS